MASHPVLIVFFFLLGSVIGSFLNVCILRIPADLSIVAPASRCPKCETLIRWYDNVPVFGWLWLRGKCRSCGQGISPMYPLVELATGLLFVACYLEFAVTQATVRWLFFTSLIIVLSVTDFRDRMLPDVVTLPGTIVGLFFSYIIPIDDGAAALLSLSLLHRLPSPHILGLADGLLGAAIGSLGFWALGALFSRLFRRQAFGLGDVKMLAMIGAFTGSRGVFFTLLFGSLIGSLIGGGVVLALCLGGWRRSVALRASRRGLGTVRKLQGILARRYQLPMGTYLGIGALVVMFFGLQLLQLWTNHFGIYR